MALFFMDGFDNGEFSRWNLSNFSSNTTTRFSVGRSATITNAISQKAFTAVSQFIIGFAFNSNNSTTYNSQTLSLYGDNGATRHLSLSIYTLGQLSLRRGDQSGTVLGTATIPSTGWFYIELSATIDSTVGTAVLRINGSTVVNYSGNTKNGGTNTTIDTISVSGSIQGHYFDDMYMCDGTGTTNNTFLGDVRVQTLKPNGAGSSTQFTPTGSASNYANVQEIPDSTSTYNSSSTVGQRDTYAMADLATNTGTIFGVQNTINAWKSDAGTGSIKTALVTNSTVYYEPTVNLGSSAYTYISPIRTTNPSTGAAWVPADINSSELGAEIA